MGPTLGLNESDTKQLAALFAAGLGNYIDAIAVHAYPYGVVYPPEDPHVGYINAVSILEDTYPNYPFLDTEHGYNADIADFSQLQQAEYDVRTTLVLLGSGYAESTLYNLADSWNHYGGAGVGSSPQGISNIACTGGGSVTVTTKQPMQNGSTGTFQFISQGFQPAGWNLTPAGGGATATITGSRTFTFNIAGGCPSYSPTAIGSIIETANLYGTFYNLGTDPNSPSAVAPKPIVAAYAAMTYLLDGEGASASTQIIDSSGGVWTVVGGSCYLNGVQAKGCSMVSQLLFYGGQIYVLNTQGMWWQWNGSGWTQIARDPEHVTASGTTIPSATEVFDANGDVWTAAGGLCYLNGAQASGCSAVHELLFYGGQIYILNTAGMWWQWNGSSWTRVANNPDPGATTSASSTTIAPAQRIFDTNGHIWMVGPTSPSSIPLAGSSQVGYKFAKNNPIGNQKILALWDWNASSTASVTVPSGAPYTVYNWMGNQISTGTSTGSISVNLSAEPIYVQYVGS
jgi:hypothetical protein